MDIITYLLSKRYIDKIAKELAGGLRYQGSKNTVADLPTPSESIKGHMYTVLENGHEYVCDGERWVDLGADLDKKADKTALEKEVQDRTTADTTLQSNIDIEANTRETNDNTLQLNIDTEKTRAEGIESGLDTRLSTIEADYLKQADKTELQNNIDTEANVRTSADNALGERINQEEITREQADTTLTTNLNTEISNRESADTTLQTNIDNEATTRATNDTTLNTKINDEIVNRVSGDNILNTHIENEATTRETADNTLQTNIDNEVSRAKAAEDTKVNITESNANGKSQFINENDGGGVFFIKDDSTSKSFVGVNDSTAGGPDAQIYAINPSDSNKGSKIDITKEKIYYTANTTLPYSQRIVEANEIAIKGDVSAETTRATTAEGVLQDNINLKADITYVDAQDATKQDKLIASTNITIADDGKTISAIDTKYTVTVDI